MSVKQPMTTDELILYMKTYSWRRRPTELHTHCTGKPRYADFNGSNHIRLQENMKRFHVKTNGWQDIGQHLTVFPDGLWVLGRDFNMNPASIEGRNSLGFAVEMLGYFDKDYDKITNEQLTAITRLWAYLCVKFNLDPKKAVVFHREYSKKGKTCPGTAIVKTPFVNLVIKQMEDYDVKKIKGFLDGKEVTAVLINNESYIKATAIATVTGKKAKWDEKTEAVTIE